jgi:hypothetical protein
VVGTSPTESHAWRLTLFFRYQVSNGTGQDPGALAFDLTDLATRVVVAAPGIVPESMSQPLDKRCAAPEVVAFGDLHDPIDPLAHPRSPAK